MIMVNPINVNKILRKVSHPNNILHNSVPPLYTLAPYLTFRPTQWQGLKTLLPILGVYPQVCSTHWYGV